MLEVKNFRELRGLMVGDIVAVMKEQYPKYDKHLHSKVERPEEYGVRLVNDAERLLEEAFAETAPKPRRPDRRRLPNKVQCRLSKAEFDRLQHALKADGFDTIQAGMTHVIRFYLGGKADGTV